MSRRDPFVLMRDMLDHAREAVGTARGRMRADLDADRMLELSLTRLVEVVGEAASRVPAEVRERHARVPWSAIVGIRNRLIHGYAYVDLDVVWDVVSRELPPLIAELERILSAQES
jgi:uncharacterized protein with HEPN domain